ncbi:MAG TPA: ANTAR domain-containing protein [Candidatus Blautia avistercoris]|uniref:ANTAR domain-containing response regulator n=1 Tax=Blautia sp. An249 TaxID=1965603 RepID=UPI000B3A1F32|nr:ANTAR domain-containing protein [Blautia sp. An249]OUO78222.1 antitermination regulator [Blautia sp. An249]HIY18251.1 ANTAR domain-containing protein [Candidatus Blautia avistercoris]
MISVIIVLPKIEDGKKIRDILVRRGFQVDAVCSSGARVLSELSQIPAGIVISGYRLKDMYYTQLADYLPSMVEMVLVGSPRVVAECGAGIAAITTPIHVSDLVNTLEMMQAQLYRRLQKKKTKKKQRSEKEQNYINRAKHLLMERNHLTEEEAYRYLQKCSMDSGTNLVETAQMVLLLNFED